MNDANTDIPGRFDQIETRWSLVRRAHSGSSSSASQALGDLVLRYSKAIRGYVRAMTRDDFQADEVAQDILVRMLKGDFAGADPQRGRFRDLLKTALRNMVRNEWGRRQRQTGADLDLDKLPDESEPQDEDPWLAAWTANLLELAWSDLEDYDRSHPGSVAHALLRLRMSHPDKDSGQLAELLSQNTGRHIQPAALRQQLRRARMRFADYLVREVADGLDNPTGERIDDELIALNLFEYVRDFRSPRRDNGQV